MGYPTLKDRIKYAFDNYMSRGVGALVVGLGMLSVAIVLLAAATLVVGSIRPEGVNQKMSFPEAVWESLMRTLDPGTMGGDAGWGFRFVMFGVTVGGIFVISTLIGVLTSGIEAKMDELRKGRSRVIEKDHTIILGWSSKIFAILSELVLANANQPKSCIVILGEHDKVEMEDAVRDKLAKTGKTRIVCRSGITIDSNDLALVSLDTARSIIILSPDSDYPDADVVKTMLAIVNASSRRDERYHIVAELRNPRNLDIARQVAGEEVELVLAGELISRIIAQTCRQSGLSVVYTELLDFSGDEIYFKSEPSLTGKTFGEILSLYEDSAVIGLFHQNGRVTLNPPMDTRLAPEDQIIAISEDDDTIHLSGLADTGVNLSAIQERHPSTHESENTLILGWNWRAPKIINELDNYVEVGSQVDVVASFLEGEQILQDQTVGVHNLEVSFQVGDTTDRSFVENLDLARYQHVIILCYSDLYDVQRADAMAMVTLMHMRDIADKQNLKFALICEILDLRNRALVEVARADDFIVSDRLISLMLAQISENKHLNAVFQDIFDAQGSEIYLKPASDYIRLETPINFYTVLESARRKGEVAFGYRQRAYANDAKRAYGVVVNPDKSQQITFQSEDRIIVLADS